MTDCFDSTAREYWESLTSVAKSLKPISKFYKHIKDYVPKLYEYLRDTVVLKWTHQKARINGFDMFVTTGTVYITAWLSEDEQRFGGFVPVGNGNAVQFGDPGYSFMIDIIPEGDAMVVDVGPGVLVQLLPSIEWKERVLGDSARVLVPVVTSLKPFLLGHRTYLGMGADFVKGDKLLQLDVVERQGLAMVVYRFYTFNPRNQKNDDSEGR